MDTPPPRGVPSHAVHFRKLSIEYPTKRYTMRLSDNEVAYDTYRISQKSRHATHWRR